MSTIAQDYQDVTTTLTRQVQEAGRTATEAWVRALRTASVRLPSVTSVAAVHELIDEVSDYTVTLVNVQRTLAKQLATATISTAESVVRQAAARVEEATEQVTEQVG